MGVAVLWDQQVPPQITGFLLQSVVERPLHQHGNGWSFKTQKLSL